MQDQWTDEPPSLQIAVPGATFGWGRGGYWRHARLTTRLKSAVADQTCTCAPEVVDKRDALALICESVQADLKKYALDFPQTDVAELVRRGHYIEALSRGLQPGGPEGRSSREADQDHVDLPPRTPPPLRLNAGPAAAEPGIEAEEPWDAVVIAEAVGILADSALHLESSHRFSLTNALVILLLVCRRAGLSYLDPRANNVTVNYLQILVTRHLITRPAWMRGPQVDWNRLYKAWGDVYKAHTARIQRAKYRVDPKARFSAVYGLNETGDIYFVRRLLEADVQLSAIEAHALQAQLKIGSATGYSQTLKQSTAITGPDEQLEDLKAM